jgi:hypothetical protein
MDLQLSMQSVPITTKVVSSNLAQGEVYSLQHYVIKFVSDLPQVGGFLCTYGFIFSGVLSIGSLSNTMLSLVFTLYHYLIQCYHWYTPGI